MGLRVLLINSNQMQPPIAPVGLEYLAEAVKQAGNEVRFLDLCFISDYQQPLADAIHEFHPQVVGVTVRNTDDCYYSGQDFVLPRIKSLIAAVRQKTSAPLVLGGVGFSIAPRDTFEFLDGDFGIEGEGEDVFCALIRRLERGGGFEGIPGLYYRVRGETKYSGPKFLDLDTLPARTRCFADNARYLNEGGQIGFETKRGCTMACVYCADPIAKGRVIRTLAPSKVVDELKSLLDKGIDHFHTCDSEFNLPEDHAIAVCEAISDAGMGDKIRWYAYCSPTPFSGELAGAMKEAGCAGIDFGVDSGDDEMLGHLKRHFKSGDLRRTAKLCREYEIPFMYDLLIGCPGESFTSVKHTINLMKEIGPDCVGAAIGARIYEGTRLAELTRNAGPLVSNPNLHGVKEDNPAFLKPVFYISADVGPAVAGYVERLVDGDPRFYFGAYDNPQQNYNYDNNSVLIEAIKQGYRGAYWDILRRLRLAGG